VIRITESCAQQGFKPATINQTATSDPAWASDSNLEGAQMTGANANPYDTSTPAVQAFRTAFDQVLPRPDQDVSVHRQRDQPAAQDAAPRLNLRLWHGL
jgi:hypothetical protein